MGSPHWGDCSQDCPKELTTNLTRVRSGDLELANHLWALHKIRKQHGIIFVGSEGHTSLLSLLFSIAPSTFSSHCPMFMPIEYMEDMKLRLDSNIIFYKAEPEHTYKIFDAFAVKGGPTISEAIGYWDETNGISYLTFKSLSGL